MPKAPSAEAAGDAVPAFIQIFGTTVRPRHAHLPDLTLVWMPRNSNTLVNESNLASLSVFLDDDDGPPALELRDFQLMDQPMIETLVAWHLKSGIIGPFSFDHTDYFKVASLIITRADIPVRASPLKGQTLATLLGGGGSIVGVLELLHNGVTPTEAVVSVLFVAGGLIVLGTANAVRRALEAGIER